MNPAPWTKPKEWQITNNRNWTTYRKQDKQKIKWPAVRGESSHRAPIVACFAGRGVGHQETEPSFPPPTQWPLKLHEHSKFREIGLESSFLENKPESKAEAGHVTEAQNFSPGSNQKQVTQKTLWLSEMIFPLHKILYLISFCTWNL